MSKPTLKPKACKACREAFTPPRPLAQVCSPLCAVALIAASSARARAKAALAERRETKAKLAKLKSKGKWLAEAKTAIQQARRLEELAAGEGCISCGRSQAEVMGTDAWKPGGAWDGGHFLGKGAHPNLALEPMNIWLQCKSCNAGSGKYARKGFTVQQSFRARLICRIGIDAVEALEADHAPRHYSIDDLEKIKKTYAAKARAIKKAMK